MVNKHFSKTIEPRFWFCFIMLLIFAVMSFFLTEIWIGSVQLVICALVYLHFRHSAVLRERELMKYIEETLTDASRASKDSTLNFPMAMAIIKIDTNEVIWGNERFEELAGKGEHLFGKRLFDLVDKFDLGWVIEGKSECPVEINLGDRTYRVYGSMFRSDDKAEAGILVTLYWLDVTDYSSEISELSAARQIVSVIMIDNYEEIMNGLNDSERSSMIADIDKRILAWIERTNGIFMKYERDKYLFIFEERYLSEYTGEKFSILDTVREIESKNGIRVTLSIGIGKDGQSFSESHKNARLAIDMALSRGGDQAVIRNKFNFEFFGGRSQELEKRTKVKSRVTANALAELIKDSSSVIIMGHRGADNDSIGAAAGIACIARKIGTRVSIVADRKGAPSTMMSKLLSAPEYEGVFIDEEEAIIEADGNTLLVVVDTNLCSQVESEALLESANKVAVIDHHRRGTDYINDAVLNFHEPYASSTCELVTELMQYLVETRDVLNCEAEAILSGIIVDTKRFSMKTGVRTFEAAAYLRRAGADTTELKRMLQDDLQTYVKRAEMVKLARMYHDNIAIVGYNGSSTRIIAAQAADELLSIRGVKASFVLYKGQGVVNVSARSLGDINVQIILERLGGGGHFETAGAQIKGKSIDEVAKELMAAIDDILE